MNIGVSHLFVMGEASVSILSQQVELKGLTWHLPGTIDVLILGAI